MDVAARPSDVFWQLFRVCRDASYALAICFFRTILHASAPAIASLFVNRNSDGPFRVSSKALRIAESVSDLELAIRTHGAAKSLFTRWLTCHIVIAIVLYGLLFVHVWSAWYFGIRWLS